MPEKSVNGYRLSYGSTNWIHKIESREHWCFYWRQASLVENFASNSSQLVEIGVGSAFLQNYLKARGRNVISVDIDENKNPDFVSDASQFNFGSLKPDCILAFEVFEHIPYPLFQRVVTNIARAEPSVIIFSLPRSVRYLVQFRLKLPKIPPLEANITIPKRKILTPNHFWELSMFGGTAKGVVEGDQKGVVGVNQIIHTFNDNGYSVKKVASEGRINFFVAEPLRKGR